MSRNHIGRFASFVGMGLAIATVSGVTLALIAEKAASPTLRTQALCTAGLIEFASTECASEQLAKLREEADRELQAAHEARELAEHALVGRIVFEEGPTVAGLTIIVGTTYLDHTARSGFVRAICWAIQDKGGLDPRVTLAQMAPDGAPMPVDIDAFERSSLGVDLQDVDAARAACPWPRAS